MEWSDNIAISDGAPAKYYPKYAARFAAEELRQMCSWHALPDGWEEMPYAEFLSKPGHDRPGDPLRVQGLLRAMTHESCFIY